MTEKNLQLIDMENEELAAEYNLEMLLNGYGLRNNLLVK